VLIRPIQLREFAPAEEAGVSTKIPLAYAPKPFLFSHLSLQPHAPMW
jgi:hypothetical protein